MISKRLLFQPAKVGWERPNSPFSQKEKIVMSDHPGPIDPAQQPSVGTPVTMKRAATETGTAVVGALVGLAVGGPTGAVAGAAAGPILTTTIALVEGVLHRRRERADRLVREALAVARVTPEAAVALLAANDDKADIFVRLIREAAESDPRLQSVLAAVLAQMLTTDSNEQRERLSIVSDAIRGIRFVHVQVLLALHQAGGTLSARSIAEAVHIPEMELRHVVRELELRGMIKDRGVHPIEWELRSLGEGIVRLAIQEQAKNG